MSKPQKKYSEIITDLMSYHTWAQHYKYWTNLLVSNTLSPRRLVKFVLNQYKKDKWLVFPITLSQDKPNPMLLAMVQSEEFPKYIESVPALQTHEFGRIFFEFFLNSNPFSDRTKHFYNFNVYRHFKNYIYWPGLLFHLASTNNQMFSLLSSVIQTFYMEVFTVQSYYSTADVLKLTDIFWESVAFGIQFPFEYLKESIEMNKSIFGMDIVNRFYPVVAEYICTKAFHPQLSGVIAIYGSAHLANFMNLILSDNALTLYCSLH